MILKLRPLHGMSLEVCKSANSKPWFNTPGIIAPIYKKHCQKANITPDQIRALDDIKKLPFLTKENLRKDQETHPPLGQHAGRPNGGNPAGAHDLRYHRHPY